MYPPNWKSRGRRKTISTSTSTTVESATITTTNFKDTRSMYRCCFGFVNRVIFFFLFLFEAYDFCLLDTSLSFHPIVFEQFSNRDCHKNCFF